MSTRFAASQVNGSAQGGARVGPCPPQIDCRYNSAPVTGQIPELPEMVESSAEELLDLIAEQRRDALAELYRRYSTAAYSFVLKILREPGAAEEVTQDAFFKVWRRAGS